MQGVQLGPWAPEGRRVLLEALGQDDPSRCLQLRRLLSPKDPSNTSFI